MPFDGGNKKYSCADIPGDDDTIFFNLKNGAVPAQVEAAAMRGAKVTICRECGVEMEAAYAGQWYPGLRADMERIDHHVVMEGWTPKLRTRLQGLPGYSRAVVDVQPQPLFRGWKPAK
jgi:hypothetical protein